MPNNLDDLVRIEIDINAPIIDTASFDTIMIFGAPPKNPTVTNIPAVGTYNDLTELTDIGYDALGDDADPVAAAARIKFSNSNSPIVVAVQQPVPALIGNATFELIDVNNAETEAIPTGNYNSSEPTLPWLQAVYDRKVALDSLDVTIARNDVVVYGSSLNTTQGAGKFLQVAFGHQTGGGSDFMELDTVDYPGSYLVTFTAIQGDKTTILTQPFTFDGTAITLGKGASVSTPLEPITDTLSRALEYDGWWLACEAGLTEGEFEECAELIEAQEKAFAYTFIGEIDPVRDIYFRSIGVCGLGTNKQNTQDPPRDEPYKHLAYAAQALKYHAGSETWANKTVAAVDPSDFSSTLKTALANGHSNWTQSIGGKNITRNGQVRAGEWIDSIRFRDWLKNDMQIRVANLLIVNPKIPYTDPGIALVENQMIASLKSGRDYGGIAPDQFDNEGNVYPGFTTSVPKAMNLTASQRYSRKLTDCKFTARLAGAIHLVEIHGSLIY